MAWFWGGGPPERTLAEIPANLALLHGLGFSRYMTWNWPSWSISVEMAVYLAFVAFVGLPRVLRAPIAALTVVISLFALSRLSNNFMYTTNQFGLLRGFAGFFAGYLTYQLWRRQPLKLNTAAELVTIAAVLGFISFAGPNSWGYAAPLVFSGAVLVFAGEAGGVSRALRSPVGLALGAWSYSIYLVQGPVIVSLRMAYRGLGLPGHLGGAAKALGSMWAADAIALGYLALLIGISAITYRYIELPGKRLFTLPAGAVARSTPA